MRTTFLMFIAMSLALSTLSGCASGNDREPLKKYLLALDTLRRTDLEESAVSAFTAVSGKKHHGDKALYQALTGCVLPKYTEFYTRLTRIRPQSIPISNLHFTYTEGARYQLLAFSNISEYMINQEPDSLRRFNELSRHAAILIGKWRAGLDTLTRSTNN